MISFLLLGLPVAFSDFSSLLSADDLERETLERESGHPALGGLLNDPEPWESYNQWKCFPTKWANLTFAEVDYGGWKKVPSITIESPSHTDLFDLEPDEPWDNLKTMARWAELFDQADEVCIYAAFLQEFDEDTSDWIIADIKTRNGYWLGGEREHQDYYEEIDLEPETTDETGSMDAGSEDSETDTQH